MHGLDSYGSEQGQVACSCGQDNEPLGYVKLREFYD
jgi:hypothetical protein